MALGLGTLRVHTKRRRMVLIEDYNCNWLGVQVAINLESASKSRVSPSHAVKAVENVQL